MPFPWSGPAGSPVAEWVWCRRHAADVGLNRSAASGEGTTVRILAVRISGVCNDRVCDACSGCRLVGIGLVSSRFCRYGLSGPANGRVDCEPGAVLEAVHMAIADLAAVLVAVRAGLGGDCVRVGSRLEMGEIDLLSARDAVEKARLEIDLAGPRGCRRPGDGAALRGVGRAAERG